MTTSFSASVVGGLVYLKFIRSLLGHLFLYRTQRCDRLGRCPMSSEAEARSKSQISDRAIASMPVAKQTKSSNFFIAALTALTAVTSSQGARNESSKLHPRPTGKSESQNLQDESPIGDRRRR